MTTLPISAGGEPAVAGLPGTRREHSLLTDPDAEQVWAQVQARLTAYLLARGAQLADAQDICQEVGARALERGVPYAHADDLLAWCLRVGRNLLIDDGRRRDRVRGLAVVPDQVRDVEAEAVLSLRARDVLLAMRELSETDRTALTGSERPLDRRHANRLAVRRHRARARLLKLIGGALAAGWATIRRLPRLALASTVAAAWVVAIFTAGPPPRPHSTAAPPARAESVHIAAPTLPLDRVPHLVAAGGPHSPSRLVSVTPPASNRPSHTVVKPQGAPQGVYIEERPRTEDDRLVCASHVPVIGELCTPN
ncbi:MAG: hypothetical protein QOJ92_552 [Frankiales bacterium]|nr:hypothetical protein [Frankiales bacterium]